MAFGNTVKSEGFGFVSIEPPEFRAGGFFFILNSLKMDLQIQQSLSHPFK